MSVMVRGSLLISVESVVESWISVMEHHASQRRTLGEMQLHKEMMIAVNEPSLVHCDSIVQVILSTENMGGKGMEMYTHIFRKPSKIASGTQRTLRRGLDIL
jgi:hypothetical protein